MAKIIKKTVSGSALVELVVDALLEKKAKDIVSLDLRKIDVSVADYFVIAHGESNTQVNALHQIVVEKAREQGVRPYHAEGMANGEWIIIDFVDVVVHIFHRDKREFYQLEELWHDAKATKHTEEKYLKAATKSVKETSAPKKTAAISKKPAARKKAAATPAKKAATKKVADKKDVKKKSR